MAEIVLPKSSAESQKRYLKKLPVTTACPLLPLLI